MNGTFGGIHTMIVGFNYLQSAIVFGKEFFDVLSRLIIHDVQLQFEPFLLQFFKVLLVVLEYADVVHPAMGMVRIA